MPNTMRVVRIDYADPFDPGELINITLAGLTLAVPSDDVIELTEERSAAAKHNDPNWQLGSRRFVSEWEPVDV